MSSLHHLTGAYLQALDDACGEWSAELDALQETVEVKAGRCALVLHQLASDEAAVAVEIARLEQRLQAIRARREQLRAYVAAELQRAGLNTVRTPLATVWTQAGPPSVVVEPGTSLPERFLRIRPAPAPEPDKRALREALEAGEAIPGVRLLPGALQLRTR